MKSMREMGWTQVEQGFSSFLATFLMLYFEKSSKVAKKWRKTNVQPINQGGHFQNPTFENPILKKHSTDKKSPVI